MKDVKFIAVTGFFSSGSSAVVDLLKEYKDVYECSAEIRIIKDPYGITQLENALVHNWDLINSAAAIRDFKWLCTICNRKRKGIFSPVGLSYSEKITKDFLRMTNEYIDDLSTFKYKSDFYYQKFKKNYFRYVIDRIRMGTEFYTHGKIKSANRKVEDSNFALLTEEEFNEKTKKYLKSLFSYCIPEGKMSGIVVLDQAISSNDPQAINRYFDDAKMIIVDRDPRDMYVEDLVRWRENLDKDVSSKEAGYKYVIRHKALRKDIPNDGSVLCVKFEDLVINYNEIVSKIESFLGFSERDHISKKMYLKPEISSKNIGIWKQYYDDYKDAIDEIGRLLPEYCFDGGKEY